MTEGELRAHLHQRGLARVADDLLALAAPTVRVYVERVDEADLPVGASKLGGRPDLPAGVDWPAWHEPMALIAQFDLAAVAPHDREGVLPTRGMLSFFYETDGEPLYSAGWGLPEETPLEQYPEIDPSLGWRVLYHQGDPATFFRRDIPPALNESARFPACAARFAAEMTLPDADGPEVEPLRLSGAERSALISLDVDVIWGTWGAGGHHLLGHPYNLGESTIADCEVAARRIPSGSLRVDSARWKEIARQAARRWRLLLQVESSVEAEMDWGGGGLLHFCIEREALHACDFSRAWLNMQVI